MARKFVVPSTDKNQLEIVKALRKIPGVTVRTEMDDLLVGYKKRNYWFELKESPKSNVQPSQYKLLKEWTGAYAFAFTVDDILEDIGITKRTALRAIFNAIWHALIRDEQTPAKASKWASEGLKRYKRNEFESVQQLIEDTIEEGKS